MNGPDQGLARVLVEAGLVSAADLERMPRRPGLRFLEQVIKSRLCLEDRLYQVLAQKLEMELVEPGKMPIHARVLALVPPETAYRHRLIPLARRRDRQGEVLLVAVGEPLDDAGRRDIASLLPEGIEVHFALAPDSMILTALEQHYGPEPRADTVNSSAPMADLAVRLGGSAALIMDETEVVLPLPSSTDPLAKAQIISPDKTATDRPVDKRGPARGYFGEFNLTRRLRGAAGIELFAGTWGRPPAPAVSVQVRRTWATLPITLRSGVRPDVIGAAEKLVGLRHPNILEVREIGDIEGIAYVAMDAVDGHDLARILAECKSKRATPSLELVLYLLEQVSAGLGYAHKKGIFHLHLAPTSVFISRKGEVKLADFGAPPLLEDGGYQAPERLDGLGGDARTDVFGVGILAIELLTLESLRLPSRRGEDRERVMAGAKKALQKQRPNLPADIERIVYTCLELEPPRRFQSAEELSRALQTARTLQGRTQAGAADLGRFVEGVSGEDSPAASPRLLTVRQEPPLDAGKATTVRATIPKLESGDAATAVVKIHDSKNEPRGDTKTEAAPKPAEPPKHPLDRLATFLGTLPVAARWGLIAGALVVVMLSSSLVASSLMRTEPTPSPPAVAEVAPVVATENVPKQTPPPVLAPGVVDAPAPEGFAYVRAAGVELRATADADGEAIVPLEEGLLLRDFGLVDGAHLVMVMPRGPAGFVDPDSLSRNKPTARLIRELELAGCRIETTLDECLVAAKAAQDKCLEVCLAGRSPRCVEVCDGAFRQCAAGCREPAATSERRRRR